MEQPELSSDVDAIICLLRSNSGTKFELQKLGAITGMGIYSLKKWVTVLEDMKMVKVTYAMSEIHVQWAKPHSLKMADGRGIDAMGRQTAKMGAPKMKICKKYGKNDIEGLLGDIGAKHAEINRLEQRKKLLLSRKAADGTMQSVLGIKIGHKKEELAYLILQAKKIISAKN